MMVDVGVDERARRRTRQDLFALGICREGQLCTNDAVQMALLIADGMGGGVMHGWVPHGGVSPEYGGL